MVIHVLSLREQEGAHCSVLQACSTGCNSPSLPVGSDLPRTWGPRGYGHSMRCLPSPGATPHCPSRPLPLQKDAVVALAGLPAFPSPSGSPPPLCSLAAGPLGWGSTSPRCSWKPSGSGQGQRKYICPMVCGLGVSRRL